MIVVFLTHNYPRFSGDLPGSFLHALALGLRQRGHDVRVVAPADRGTGGREALDGIPVRRVRYAPPGAETLAYTGTMQEALRSPRGVLRLRGLIRALRQGAREELALGRPRDAAGPPLLLHAHWWVPAGLAAPAGVPRVITLHGTDARILGRNLLTRALGRRVLRRADLVTAVSPEIGRLVERVTGRAGAAGHVQPMPVETTGWPWGRGGGGLIVVSRLTQQKRVELAIRAAAALARGGLVRPLTIVGEGPERPALEREAAARPALPVRFLGALPRAAVLAELERADAMLFTARDEGFGLAAIEALMTGVPVVACRDGGGVVSALGRHGGGFVAAPAPEDLARALGEALTDRAREAARRAGVLWRGDLAPDRVAARFEEWYAEALAR